MEELKSMKQTLIAAAQSQMGNLEHVNAKELGEVIDMIKDLEEALYYCSITKAMEDSKEERDIADKVAAAANASTSERYYTIPYYRYLDPRYEDWDQSRRYTRRMYTEGGDGSTSYMGTSSQVRDTAARDVREGRSPMSRCYYMEGKEQHREKTTQLQELEKYMSELSQDVTEMIKDASQEEKLMLQQKLQTLAGKIQSV